MRFELNQEFLDELRRFNLCYHCEHCVHFDPETSACVHGYPTRDHRSSSEAEGQGELVFCKEFELI